MHTIKECPTSTVVLMVDEYCTWVWETNANLKYMQGQPVLGYFCVNWQQFSSVEYHKVKQSCNIFCCYSNYNKGVANVKQLSVVAISID
jgi:hypothetical protein